MNVRFGDKVQRQYLQRVAELLRLLSVKVITGDWVIKEITVWAIDRTRSRPLGYNLLTLTWETICPFISYFLVVYYECTPIVFKEFGNKGPI